MIDYKVFFNHYRTTEVKDNKDLLYQVGWTQGKNPISEENFKAVVTLYEKSLDLTNDDLLIDLCCGNGVITYELSKKVKQVVAIDFSEPYIKNARSMKAADNIIYHNGNIIDFAKIIDPKIISNYKKENIKILMSFSLGYFKTEDLKALLLACNNFEIFKFYITGIPDFNKHALIFNTISKKMSFIFNDRLLGKTQGIGRFWKLSEINNCVKQLKLNYETDNNLNFIPGNSYRFNVLIRKAN